MTTFKVEILNPEAEKLLKYLADIKLISIKETSQTSFADVLNRLRSNPKKVPSLDTITKEVEAVRSKRNGY